MVPDDSRSQTAWALMTWGTYARAPYAFAALGQGPKGPELVYINNIWNKWNKSTYHVCNNLELTCPGDCSNAGNCDTSTGKCSCVEGRHGLDCSSEY